MSVLGYLILSFIIIFIVIFVMDYVLFVKPAIAEYENKKKEKKNKRGRKKKSRTSMEIEYLISRFHLEREKLNYEKLKISIPIFNSFIITFTTILIEFIPVNIIFKMLIGFVVLISLIYAIYEIYGNYLLSKERKK